MSTPGSTLSVSLGVVVLTTKASGVDIVFGTYLARAEAESVVAQLAKIGCPARVAPARANEIAGLERRARRKLRGDER